MYQTFIKRGIDLILSLLLLILCSPILLIAAIAMKIEAFDEPIIFKQLRCGKDAVPFTIYKLRSMPSSTPSDVPTEQMNSDHYITGLGRFLRKSSIDELPQLFNILKGDMSFVGPRPVILNETELIERRKQLGAYRVKPGVTGLAQINGRDNVSVEEKAQYDAKYAREISFLLDLKLFFRTIPAVLFRKDIKG